jgi:putative transposase
VRDQTYIKLKGKWTYRYCAIDKQGQTPDFMLSERHEEAAATAFFAKRLPVTVGRTKLSSTKVGPTRQDCST